VFNVEVMKRKHESDLQDALFILERRKDEPLFQAILNMERHSCYWLFRFGNETVDDVEYISSFYGNCYLDDSEAHIEETEHFCESMKEFSESVGEEYVPHKTYHIIWEQNDDRRQLSIEDTLEIIRLTEVADSYYKEHKEEVEFNYRDSEVGQPRTHHDIWWSLKENVDTFMKLIYDKSFYEPQVS